MQDFEEVQHDSDLKSDVIEATKMRLTFINTALNALDEIDRLSDDQALFLTELNKFIYQIDLPGIEDETD